MHEQAIAIFCICDELVKFYGLIDDPQCKMSTAEVMTLALISALHYQCDYRLTRLVSQNLKYFPAILSHSRLTRVYRQFSRLTNDYSNASANLSTLPSSRAWLRQLNTQLHSCNPFVKRD